MTTTQLITIASAIPNKRTFIGPSDDSRIPSAGVTAPVYALGGDLRELKKGGYGIDLEG